MSHRSTFCDGLLRRSFLHLGCVGLLFLGHARAGEALEKHGKAIDALIEQLGDDSFHRRQAAHAQLAKLGERARAALEQAAARHKDLEIRHRAVELLVPLFASRVAPLIEQLGDELYDRREDAQKQLVKIGLPALTALRRASVYADDLEIRSRSRKAIAAITGARQ
jgi:hypothetical protein